MPDSLNLAGRWELMSQTGNPADLPSVSGPPADWDPPAIPQPYMLVTGYDLGSPVPVTNTVVGDILDGDRVAGRRTGNKSMTLPIQVTAPDRLTLAQLTDQLMAAVDAPTFTLRWWPDGGAPAVWDCYRATSSIVWDQRWEGLFLRVITVVCSAFPFARSTDRQTITGAATPTVIDAMDADAPTGATLDTTFVHDGTHSAKVVMTWVVSHWGNYYHAPTAVTRSYSGANRLDVSGSNSLTFWARVNSASTAEDFEFTLTLNSAHGSITMQVVYTNMPTQSWRLVSFPLRRIQSRTGNWDPTLVTGYTLFFRDYRQNWVTAPGETTHQNTLRVNLDTMQLNPSSTTGLQTADGTLLTVPGVLGTAKTPIALELDNTNGMSGALLHRPPSDADPNANILNALATGTDQTITIAQAAAGYNGTYTVVLAMSAASATTHSVTVTVNQRAGSANTIVGTQTLTTAFTPTSPFPYLTVGQITLPIRALPLDGSQTTTTYTIRVRLNAGDAATDILLLDTRGPTCVAVLGAQARSLYVDEPDPRYGLGLVLASANPGDRSGCYGVMDQVRLSGGPFSFMPGDNTVLIHSTAGSPTLTATYAPRWMGERSGGDVVQT